MDDFKFYGIGSLGESDSPHLPTLNVITLHHMPTHRETMSYLDLDMWMECLMGNKEKKQIQTHSPWFHNNIDFTKLFKVFSLI